MSPRRMIHTAVVGEAGQAAVMVVLSLLVVLLFFALAFDSGLWYFDHRTAQNQAEAAALAGVQLLPDDETSAAAAAVDQWLAKNGSGAGERSCLEFSDRNSDGRFDTVRVCVSRASPGVFSSLSGIEFATVSAAATATVGPVTVTNVMPWAIVPPDRDCGPDAGRNCVYDANGDGDYLDNGDCDAEFVECPWGLNLDKLYLFKSGGGGNTGIIDACGGGAVSYRDCIEGEIVSGFFEEGSTVYTGLQGGNLGQNTDNALRLRYPSTTWTACDVGSTPEGQTGYDPDGKAVAVDRFVETPLDQCVDRLVVIPILYELPPTGGGSADLEVLGVATFAIAKWNRQSNRNTYGNSTAECSTSVPATGSYACGMVWGYLVKDAQPPGFLLEQIGNSNNPFAPLLVALID